jgi:hypothetical protein
MKNYTILKLLGLTILTMAVLVILSVIEVAIYSYIINPGQEQGVYNVHANESAPYISAIFGFIVFFLVLRHWKKKGHANLGNLAILFPVVYLLFDLILILSFGVNWSDFIVVFAISNGAKCLGSYLGYKFAK